MPSPDEGPVDVPASRRLDAEPAARLEGAYDATARPPENGTRMQPMDEVSPKFASLYGSREGKGVVLRAKFVQGRCFLSSDRQGRNCFIRPVLDVYLPAAAVRELT